MNIFVGNLSFDVSGADIEKLFKGFGDVASAVIVTQKGKKTPKSRGFGFVEMPDEPQARAAIAALNGKEFMGRVLEVNTARLRKEVQRGSEIRRKTWPRVDVEARRYPREESEQRKSWINPAFNKSGTYRAPRSTMSYMKRNGSTEIREEPKPWRKREDQPKPWQKSPGEGKPWKKAEEGDRRPWRKAEGEAKPWSKPRRSGFKPWERTEVQPRPWKRPESGFESGKKPSEETKPWRKREDRSRPWQKSPGERKPWKKPSEEPKPWSKREDQPRPWQKSPGEGKPWKKAEEGDRRPWRKAEGEAKPWNKPRRSGFKPWERTESQPRLWKRPEGGFKPGQKTGGEFRPWKKPAGDTKPWSKSSERPRRSGLNPANSSFDKRRINPERVKRVEGPLRTALSERSEPNGRGRTKGRKKPG